mgnify:CR=1 FL=1
MTTLQTNFNFIMILFYLFYFKCNILCRYRFQFHYDLILLHFSSFSITDKVEFQFHYDLILFIQQQLSLNTIHIISISLWSYSISKFTCFFQHIFCISISLWSYSIFFVSLILVLLLFHFNFIALFQFIIFVL